MKLLIEANLYISVIVILIVGLMSVTGSVSLFEFNEELYGPLANNLRIMLIYLSISEVIICAYSYLTKNFRIFIAVGFFLILSIGSMKFYGTINDIAVDDNFFVFFLYTGLSHIIYGTLNGAEKDIQVHKPKQSR